MRRLFWVAVGAGTAVAALRKAHELTDRHVPAGARSALGAAAGLTGAVRRARAEFATATAQREAELRADLVAGADLTRSHATVDAWRADRAARRSAAGGAPEDAGTHTTALSGTDVSGSRGTSGSTARRGRPGSARAAADRITSHPRPGAGSHRAEDPEDGPEGYSF